MQNHVVSLQEITQNMSERRSCPSPGTLVARNGHLVASLRTQREARRTGMVELRLTGDERLEDLVAQTSCSSIR